MYTTDDAPKTPRAAAEARVMDGHPVRAGMAFHAVVGNEVMALVCDKIAVDVRDLRHRPILLAGDYALDPMQCYLAETAALDHLERVLQMITDSTEQQLSEARRALLALRARRQAESERRAG